ncbi:uncharacterized protein PADG_05605 [Paracoccidioides brasiliensis Pb18]|uniref:YMC020W-like alpha/beta hydrolase domain-containing protein n=1 Tax=Paracoccidioides brasiliensis (strain Pb18) TaxID=502780 RepID=C1GEB9_PARBD|nr:uncharacterized protein PADG_05605 [Paracoccidioides brasiliensis Pb18]EEH49526.1 hypothetical protein PADG_05605 [Paracoccidioides brasiliensis Pb18]ODH53119.1 hypothetical protein GX48_00654 [Paracoccidioides brasiliensis]
MAPAGLRKRVNPNVPNQNAEPVHALLNAGMNPGIATDTGTPYKPREKAASWYIQPWPSKSKAPAVTEVARESISAEGPRTLERKQSTPTLFSQARSVRSPSIGLTKKVGGSMRSLPAEVATTRINIASISSPAVSNMQESDKTIDVCKKDGIKDDSTPILPKTSGNSLSAKELGQRIVGDILPDRNGPGRKEQESQSNQASGWLSWLPLIKTGVESTSKIDQIELPSEVVTQAPRSSSQEEQEEVEEEPEQKDTEMPATQIDAHSTSSGAPNYKKRSWPFMWGGCPAPPQPRNDLDGVQECEECAGVQDSTAKNDAIDPQADLADTQPQDTDLTSAPTNTTKSSSWLFWYRETSTVHVEQSAPRLESAEDSTRSQNKSSASIEVSKPEPGSVDTDSQREQPKVESITSDGPSKSITKKSTGPTKDKLGSTSTAKIVFPNQVLPTFRDSFPIQQKPGIIQQLGRLLYYTRNTEHCHVTRTTDPPRIKRALAIGVHGYFPAPLIRTVLGQPTGTSVKFSTLAAEAISSWAESRSYSCEIQKIALEGEGRISERVDLLWKLLLDYIEVIKKADFIMVACHSQGVPVATMLVAKLIAFGCVNYARIGICAMAGVNLGPFPDYRSRWISGSAGELFDFANPNSKVSQDHIAALEAALDFGVRIVYVGSIDDQLVSLESSTFASVSHPHIYRAVFVDGRVHAPSFLSHLVGFAMKLRNLGISDHGLIRELSSPLAGSLYSGEGHSRLYDDETVYLLAVEYTLETLPVANAKLEIKKFHRSQTPNPYILPFAMRGVLEEEYVRRELSKETAELLRLFDDWKPTSKVLKDVKFRLEGIRSKL